MAIKLTNKLNTAPVSASYPFGNIKDRVGATPGTAVNTVNHADFHQFFEKMMNYAGLAHNNLPDNQTNGFQLFEALLKVARQNLPTLSTSTWSTNDVFTFHTFVTGANEGASPLISINAFRSGGITTISGVVRIECDTTTSAITTPNEMYVYLNIIDAIKPATDYGVVVRGVATGIKNGTTPIPAIVLFDDGISTGVLTIISNYEGASPTIVSGDIHDVYFSITYKSI